MWADAFLRHMYWLGIFLCLALFSDAPRARNHSGRKTDWPADSLAPLGRFPDILRIGLEQTLHLPWLPMGGPKMTFLREILWIKNTQINIKD